MDLGYSDIRPAHGNIFQYIQDEGSKLVDLAERAQLTKQSTAELIDQLESIGYVERIPDPHDRRAKLIRTTAQGERLFEDSWRVIAAIESVWTKRVGGGRMRELRSALADMVNDVAPVPTSR